MEKGLDEMFETLGITGKQFVDWNKIIDSQKEDLANSIMENNGMRNVCEFKEQPMKPIFENEDECREFISECVWNEFGNINSKKTIKIAYEKGYIKKSELEIVRGNWYNVVCDDKKKLFHASNYIEFLQNEIERLKK